MDTSRIWFVGLAAAKGFEPRAAVRHMVTTKSGRFSNFSFLLSCGATIGENFGLNKLQFTFFADLRRLNPKNKNGGCRNPRNAKTDLTNKTKKMVARTPLGESAWTAEDEKEWLADRHLKHELGIFKRITSDDINPVEAFVRKSSQTAISKE